MTSIASDHAMILPHRANPRGYDFRERQLDTEALSLLKRAAPLPPPPAGVPDSDLTFVVPIRFVLK
jgi:hypothetical protein